MNSKLLVIPAIIGCFALAGYGLIKLAEKADDSDIIG